MGDAAGAEEGGPVGGGGVFGKGVVSVIAKVDAGESPGARGGIGIELAAGEGDAAEIGARDVIEVSEVERG